MPGRWIALDISRPCSHLRELADLSLSAAAEALGLAQPSSVHGAERREERGELASLRTLLERAEAFGFDVEIRVRRK